MDFDAKVHFARGLEGLSQARRRSRFRKRMLAGGLALALVAAAGWAALNTGSGGWVGDLLPGGGTSPDTFELFRRMSFLPQQKRPPAPAFFLRGLDGQNHSLQQYAGNVVLLNFWATWCPPCVREMPAIQRLYERFRADGLAVVAISLDQGNPDGVRDFVEKLKLTFPVVLDPDQIAKGSYRVRALPTTYLLDREGKVVAQGMGAREWDGEAAIALMKHLLGEKG